MKKPFSKSLYEASDSKAKENMILWLLEKFPKCSINSKETTYFDITLETDNGSPDHFYEVEIKYSWKEDWPDNWDELRIPYRKKRLLDKWKEEYSNNDLTFVVFNNDCTKAWHVDANILEDCEVKEVSNRHVKEGELFFHIPTNQAYQVDMTHGSSSS